MEFYVLKHKPTGLYVKSRQLVKRPVFYSRKQDVKYRLNNLDYWIRRGMPTLWGTGGVKYTMDDIEVEIWSAIPTRKVLKFGEKGT